MVNLEVKGAAVQIEDGAVSAQPVELARLLEDYLSLYPSPGPSEPDPDLMQAERIVSVFGGRILSADPPPAYEAGVIY